MWTVDKGVEAQGAVVVVGLGNLLRGDDAAGIAVVRRLRAAAGVRAVEQDGGAIALADAIRGARAAFVVDAASGAIPGRVRRWDAVAQPLPHGLFGASSHGFGVAEGIELARALGELPPTCIVYALEGARFDLGALMSEAVEDAVVEVARRIEAELNDI